MQWWHPKNQSCGVIWSLLGALAMLLMVMVLRKILLLGICFSLGFSLHSQSCNGFPCLLPILQTNHPSLRQLLKHLEISYTIKGEKERGKKILSRKT